MIYKYEYLWNYYNVHEYSKCICYFFRKMRDWEDTLQNSNVLDYRERGYELYKQ